MSVEAIGVVVVAFVAIAGGAWHLAKANKDFFEGMMSVARPMLLFIGSAFFGYILGGYIRRSDELSEITDTLAWYIFPTALLLYAVLGTILNIKNLEEKK
jgi:cytochrome bd-type quinol oxidase subunit 2